MILVIDVNYKDNKAKAVCIEFKNEEDEISFLFLMAIH